jgi:diguanylate cyclase (GGDEF)-like protein
MTNAYVEWSLSDIMSEFARTMLTDFPIQGILDHLVHQIVDVMPVTGAGVTLISSSIHPHYVAASDGLALAYEELQSELSEGPCIVAYRTGEAVAISDLRDERRFEHFASRALEAGLAAVFTFPLRHEERQLGALDLYRSTAGPLSKEALITSQTLADVASAYLVNAQARSDLAESSALAQATALHDPLTGLPNRTLLIERIEHALLGRRRSEKVVAVLFIDLDGFKKVNDRLGHQVGDDLLIAVGQRLTAALRPADTLARLSGDEFIAVCPELNQQEEVEGIAARLDHAMAAPFELGPATVKLSASIGIAFAAPSDNPEQLLHSADMAMYQVKRKGGARHQVIDQREQERTEYRDSLQLDVGHAVERHQLRLEYQPVVRMTDHRVICVEALLRWDHPDRGPISPALLIPFAEESGAINEIGLWVLQQACVDRHRWQYTAGSEPFVMDVNVSAHQLMAPGFVGMVGDIISSTRTGVGELCVEITEGAFIQDAERALDVLLQLKALGVLVALDDFGTGYSSLSYLKEFPVDVLKIDQSFVADLGQDNASYAIVSKTIELAHLLDLIVVCEGVETSEQYRHVGELTSDYSQGFFLSRPMSADRLDDAKTKGKSAWTIAV